MKKRKRRIVIPIVIVVLVAAVMASLFFAMRNSRASAVGVKLVSVEKKDLKQYLSVTGTVVSENTKEYFAVNGKIKEIKVKVGDRVSIDDILATYELTDIAKRTISDKIKAENAGVVTQVNEEAGLTAAAGPIIVVQDMNKLQVEAWLGRFESSDVRVGQEAIIKTNKKTYAGKVSFVAPAAEKLKTSASADAMLKIIISFDKKADLIPGFDIDAEILTAEAENVLVVPGEAVRTDKDGKSSVFFIQNNKAVQKEVSTGLQSDTQTQIINGVKQGDVIIQNPGVLVNNGTRVYLSDGKSMGPWRMQ